MYKKMLVPLDGSRLAEIVLPYSRQLAGRLDLDLVLLHVCEQDGSESESICRSYIDHSAELVQSDSREVQRKTGAPGGGNPVNVKSVVMTGHPADAILDYAGDNDIDIILMASHGHSGVRDLILGSVVEKVLRRSPIPIWLVHSSIAEEKIYDEWMKRMLVVPLDGSKFAESVLPHIELLVKQRGIENINVILIRVYEKPFVTADYPEPDWEEHVRRMTDQFKREAEDYLSGVQKKLSDSGLNVSSAVLEGKAAEEIISYADKHHPDIIVMATHGDSLGTRWEYGNVTDKVLHGASSPIFLVRPTTS